MSLRKAISYLKTFGVTEKDALVYIYLAKKGPQRAISIAATLNLSKCQLYESLRYLRDNGIVRYYFSRSTEFSAVSFEKAMDLLLQSNLNEVNILEKQRREILSKWKSSDIQKL